MASKPWTEEETAILRRLAKSNNRDWLGFALMRMPDRSIASVRARMQMVRLETGSSRSHTNGNEWIADARAASQRLAEATLRVGVWS